uniref:Uncharacterized protein n=1 Tax=Cacopsylla melanoneura TaxID=428564 RepID=A0A8D8Z3Q1_9HEMI
MLAQSPAQNSPDWYCIGVRHWILTMGTPVDSCFPVYHDKIYLSYIHPDIFTRLSTGEKILVCVPGSSNDIRRSCHVHVQDNSFRLSWIWSRIVSFLFQWSSMDFGSVCDAEIRSSHEQSNRHGVPCTALDDHVYSTTSIYI